MAIWTQGGFFQELAEREQHLQWYPKAWVPAVKEKDDFVVSITCCNCGVCKCCKLKLEKEKPKEEEKPKDGCKCGGENVHKCSCHCCCKC